MFIDEDNFNRIIPDDSIGVANSLNVTNEGFHKSGF
jgi:hypothetical protein